MTNSMKQTVIKNPTWWKRRSALERGLTIVAVCAILAAVAFAIGLAFVATKVDNCETVSNAEALKEKNRPKTPQVVHKPIETCTKAECVHTASSILDNMDPKIEPCDDFYAFACGNFLKNTIIPDDKTSVNTFSIISDKLQKQLRESIEEELKPNDPRPFRLLKTLYQSCMNKTLIEEKGLEPVITILKELGGWPVLIRDWNEGNFNWKESVYRFRKMGYSVDYFIDFSISVDLKNSTKRVIDLDQASLGLSREYLSRGISDKIVKAYYDYMVDIAVILGADETDAKEQLKQSLEFEIKLSNISLPSEKRRNATALYNPMTITQLINKFPSIPWAEYFNTLLAPTTKVTENEYVVVNVPSFIRQLEKLLEQTPKRVQANYVMWRAAASSVSFLNEEIRKRQLAYSTIVSGGSISSIGSISIRSGF